jgi:hypothetical protein
VGADWFDIRTVRGRGLVYASDLCVVGAGVVLALVGRRWSWGPFVLGPTVGVAGLGAYAALLGIVIKVVRADDDQLRKAREGLRQRNMVVIPGYLCFGLCAGLIAGSLHSYSPDVVLALMILVVGLLVPLAVLPVVKRKADALREREESTG